MPAVNLIKEIPPFVSPDEHRNIIGSTPTSFNDILPVLRHHEDNVSVKFDPAIEGFTDEDAAHGALFVLTSVLVFMSTTGTGFQIEYPAITLHAISRGEQAPSIYCQLDDNAGDDIAIPSTDEEEDTELRELSIFPQNTHSLEPIFETLSMCAALHPDKATSDEEFEGANHAFVDGSTFETFMGDEGQELSEVGRAAFAHLESIIDDPHNIAVQSVDTDDGGEPGGIVVPHGGEGEEVAEVTSR